MYIENGCMSIHTYKNKQINVQREWLYEYTYTQKLVNKCTERMVV